MPKKIEEEEKLSFEESLERLEEDEADWKCGDTAEGIYECIKIG